MIKPVFCTPEDLELLKTSSKIGIFFTGGVESTLLLYELSKFSKKIQLYTVLRPYVNLERIKNIINYINSFNGVAVDFLFTIPTKGDVYDGGKTFIRWARHLADVEVDALYIGSNEHMEHLPKRQYLNHSKIILPFKGLQKDRIVEMYKNEGLIDLLNMTHSCFIETIEHCGRCIGCIERTWAFERNNI
jgi:hypothetical protein